MAKKPKLLINILAGIILFIVFILLLPEKLFSFEARIALATITTMVYWWITQPVHIAVTALLPIIINAVFNVAPMSSVLSDYFSPIVVLLLGAMMILSSWSQSGLDKRIALKALTIIGTSVKKQIVIWFLLATVMSMFLPNAVVAAALCPVAAAMIQFSLPAETKISANKTLYLILLAIVWGAGIGGFGTPLGGAMNLVAIEYIEKFTGMEYMYITWTVKMLPYLLILVIGIGIYLLTVKTDSKTLPGSREYFKNEYKKLGKIKKSEVISLAFFIAAVVLAFTRPLYEKMLPEFKPYYAFLLAGLALFFIKGDDKKALISWETAAKDFNWGLIILFSGGLAAGNLIISTKAADALSQSAVSIQLTDVFILAILFITLGIFLANASSNTAATAVLIPVVISIVGALAPDPMPFIYISAAACNCAYVLPTSIRAIPIGYGMDVKFMLKKGIAAVVISLVLLSIVAYIQIIMQ